METIYCIRKAEPGEAMKYVEADTWFRGAAEDIRDLVLAKAKNDGVDVIQLIVRIEVRAMVAIKSD